MCLLLLSFNIKISFNFLCKNNNFIKKYYLLKVKYFKNYKGKKIHFPFIRFLNLPRSIYYIYITSVSSISFCVHVNNPCGVKEHFPDTKRVPQCHEHIHMEISVCFKAWTLVTRESTRQQEDINKLSIYWLSLTTGILLLYIQPYCHWSFTANMTKTNSNG